MGAVSPPDIGFIADAIVNIRGYLHDATVSPDPRAQAEARVKAARTGCDALETLLAKEELWSGLRELYQQLQRWRELQVPVVAELLSALRPEQSTSATALIDQANELLQEAVGFPRSRSLEDPITEAQVLIKRLKVLTCEVASSEQRQHRWREVAQTTLRVLGKVLLTAIAIPTVQAGFKEIAPHALSLLEELGEHASAVLPSLSMGVIAEAPWVTDQDLERLRDHDRPPADRGVTRYGSDKAERTTTPYGQEGRSHVRTVRSGEERTSETGMEREAD